MIRTHAPRSALYHSLALGYQVPTRAFARHSLVAWIRALVESVRMIATFDAGGSDAAAHRLGRIVVRSCSMPGAPAVLQRRKMQCDAACLRAWLHLLVDARACFAESFALCAGLRCLGWDGDLIVGYACVEVFAPTPMHAWVAYQGIPVSDPLDVAYGYTQFYRYRSQQEATHAI